MRKAKKKQTVSGLEVRSGFEKKVAQKLLERKADFTYESEKIKYEVPSSTHVYTPDFRLASGIYIEAKGRFDLEARKKMELVVEQHPELDIRMLFMRDNLINKKAKTTYSGWCDKRGIKCHVSPSGEVPDEWLISND